jgi:adenylate cyclase
MFLRGASNTALINDSKTTMLKPGTRQRAIGICLQIIGWSGAALLFYLIRFQGLESAAAVRVSALPQVDHAFVLRSILVAGALLGLGYGILDIFLDRPRLRQLPYLWLILTQTAFHLILLISVVAALQVRGMLHLGEPFTVSHWLTRTFSVNTLVILLYTGVVSFGFNFIKQVSRKFGPGNLRRLLLGKYYHPRRENRIFLFLDLKSSTTHAERLGHQRYSSLIQDCFRDLAVTLEHRTEVYQYVGDEAVLSWEAETGLEDLNCLRAFYRFRNQLRARADHYESHYGFVPEFKAGGNIGEVTGVEVGEIKREIAFHGDVLNAAARIQALCNEYREELLISEYLRCALPPFPDFTFHLMGTMQLRGRQMPLDVYAVRRSSPETPAAKRVKADPEINSSADTKTP